ncbi:hypothetical protein LTR10_001978 [Elasticomyces elasticus]|nr:hypothetical protein LTR10_001978 [Elasticomyces elasticus]KAK4969192.1 hypothetical protein LTR42_009471 [Elasticomyces elasticus]
MRGQAPQDAIGGTLTDVETILRALGLRSANESEPPTPFKLDQIVPYPLEYGAMLVAVSVGSSTIPTSQSGERHAVAWGMAHLLTKNIKELPPGANGREWMKASTASVVRRVAARQLSAEAEGFTAGCTPDEVTNVDGVSTTRMAVPHNMRPAIFICDYYEDGLALLESEQKQKFAHMPGVVKVICLHDLYNAARPECFPKESTTSGVCRALGMNVPMVGPVNVKYRAELVLAATLAIGLKVALTARPAPDPPADPMNALSSKALVLPTPLPLEGKPEFDNFYFTQEDMELLKKGKRPTRIKLRFDRYSDLTRFFGIWLIAQAQHYGYPNLEKMITVSWSVKRPTRNWLALAQFVAAHMPVPPNVLAYVAEIIRLRSFVSKWYNEMAKAVPDSEAVAEENKQHEHFVTVMMRVKDILELREK